MDGEGEADTAKWVRACGGSGALAKRGESTLVVAGYRQPKEVHLAALGINAILQNIGETVVLQAHEPSGNGSIQDLAFNFEKGDNLVVMGGDPAHNAPADVGWNAIVEKADKFIRHGFYGVDQTSKKAKAFIPAAHYLESWGDARTSDGTLVPVQPLIAPLFGGLTELEVLARLAGAEETIPTRLLAPRLSRSPVRATASGTNFYTTDFWQTVLELRVR